MKYLFTLLFLLNAFISDGQKIRFSDTTNFWRLIGFDHNYDRAWRIDRRYVGTTEKNGIEYKVLTNGVEDVLIREDTVAQKVYAIFTQQNDTRDTSEIVLYDFSLNVGDTFKIRYQQSFFDTTYKYIISHIDSVTINGIWHKIFTYKGYLSDFKYMEGIGSLIDPVYPFPHDYFEQGRWLSCFYNQKNTPAVIPAVKNFDNNKSCNDTAILSIEDHSIAKHFTIYPQPAHSTIRLKFDLNISSGNLYIYNTSGNILYNEEFKNKTEILIKKPLGKSGLYFYRIVYDNGNSIHTGRLLFE